MSLRWLHGLAKGGLLAATLSALAATAAGAIEISGAGATFPDAIYAKWADAYAKESGIGLSYQSIGSAAGIKQIIARRVTFGASDKPLDQKELDSNGLIQFPMIMGGVVIVFNLQGLERDALVLDGPTLAKIFMGKVMRWDDPAIQQLNGALKLPSLPISVVHRSDGSGTTYCFTSYLSEVSADWKSKIGAETAVEWPTGTGAKRNDGVASTVAENNGAIGYVDYAAAQRHKLSFAALINKSGNKVLASNNSFQAAAANADWKTVQGYGLMLTDQPGENSWPIAAVSYILMNIVPDDVASSAEALKFFDWAYAQGDEMAEELGYVPMPRNVVELSHAEWGKIKDAAGRPIFSMN